MTGSLQKFRAVLLAALMVVSVFGGAMVVAGATDGTENVTTDANAVQETPAPQEDSAKAMTVSYFRDDNNSDETLGANGPYPVLPNEYDDDEAGIEMISNAKADDHIAIDNSTALNPNGQWDMLTLGLETTGLEELDPPDGENRGLVTENFLENDDWNVDVSQVDGDKTLDIAASQEDFEAPPTETETEHEIPPVMVFADTEVVNEDFLTDGTPETSLFVWVDPNRAVLDENGEEASFETGEEYEAQFDVHGETQSVTFEMVDGSEVNGDKLSPANSGDTEAIVESPLSANTDVKMVLEPENGENQTAETTVSGNTALMDGENPGTVPMGEVSSRFDLSGMENEEITVHLYGAEERGGDMTAHAGSATAEVEDIIDPDATIENATIRDSKTMTVPYTNPDHDTPAGIGNQIGDGDVSGDSTIAKNMQANPAYFDEMWLHYETDTDWFDAIEVSPGQTPAEKFVNSPASLEVSQVNGDKELDLSENASGVYFVPDEGDSDARIYNTSEQTGYFFSFKLNEMVFFEDGEETQPEVGDEFEATLTLDTEEGEREETTSFEIVEGQSLLPGDELELQQSENAEITANSTLARATGMGITLTAESEDYEEVSGEIALSGMGQAICCDGPATEPWGELTTTFDTSDLPIGTEITAEVRVVADLPSEYDQPITVYEATGEIVEPPSGSVSVSDQSGAGDTVTVDEAQLSDGGFLSVRTGSGATIGSSDYLESGTSSDVEISLDEPVEEDTTLSVVAHLDDNDNEAYDFPLNDQPYTNDDGETIAANGEYTVEDEGGDGETETPDNGTDTETPDNGTDTETEEEETEEEDTDTETEDDGDGIPGFGVAAALIALLASGFVLYRRD